MKLEKASFGRLFYGPHHKLQKNRRPEGRRFSDVAGFKNDRNTPVLPENGFENEGAEEPRPGRGNPWTDGVKSGFNHSVRRATTGSFLAALREGMIPEKRVKPVLMRIKINATWGGR